MYVVEVLPIFRGKFSQNTKHFFTNEGFGVGDLIEIPFSKSFSRSIVLKTKNLSEIKQQIRKENLEIKKLEKTIKFHLVEESTLKKLEDIAKKSSWHISDVLNKILTSKNIKRIDVIGLKEEKDIEDVKQFLKNFDFSKIASKRKKVKLEQRGVKISGIEYNLDKKIYKAPTEKHFLVNEIREYFGERAIRGFGSFSHYIGFFQKIPNSVIYQIFSEAKYSRKSTEIQKRIFWKKIGEYLKK